MSLKENRFYSGGNYMSAIASSFIGSAVKAVIFAAIAYAGILCGKKYRDSRNQKSEEK